MSISADYSAPVSVNGYLCRNCTDVDNAKKHIDPLHPRSGPYGITAKDDPSQPAAVRFGGALSALNTVPASPPRQAAGAPGARLDLTA